ncbi:bifunctional hydroxymethylpyrimidine kinase/phosphomethylpyrimidine kinase [Spirosoma arcticum]
MDTLKVLAINSLPVNGNAGLKMVMSVLGTRALPVPTLLLSGIGNMPGHQRYAVPFADLLNSTLTMARQNGYQLVVYVGYLGSVNQAGIIADALTRFADLVRFVLIDPVCGDNGRAYVADNIIDSWHQLLPFANLALPNLTETALLSGYRHDIDLTKPEPYLSAFRQRYPALESIVTGIICDDRIVNRWLQADTRTDFSYAYYARPFSGTGDTFASLFVHYRFFHNLAPADAIDRAGLTLERLIWSAVEADRPELPVEWVLAR